MGLGVTTLGLVVLGLELMFAIIDRRIMARRTHPDADVLRSPGRGLLIGAPVATRARRELSDVGLWLGLLPMLLATPFALPWLDPPA
jgi:hypothetical protein